MFILESPVNVSSGTLWSTWIRVLRQQGIKFLLSKGCIKSNTPHDIAAFIHHTPGLHKTMVGEYLGEGDDEIIPIMHAYVDLMDFTGLSFMSALRSVAELRARCEPGRGRGGLGIGWGSRVC